ncbi:MAG: hypothetical protein DDT21_01527 [Syntrophomonadaceae bacterium]|nr:hypothetical protein [Bacillota bacterium]
MDRYNSEGYPDPTAAEALSNVAREEKAVETYRPLVYVASPFAGDTEYNISKARGYCRFAVSKGCTPLAPHLLYPQFMDDGDGEERELGLFFALVLLGKCDELWVFGEKISKGMAAEIAKAKKRGMPIKYFNHKCEVLGHGT